MAPATSTKMTCYFLGNSGLLVPKLAVGSWMYREEYHTVDSWYEMMKTVFKRGVNFFDNTEMYCNGQAEENMVGAIKKGIEEGTWTREVLVVTTKIFAGYIGFTESGPNDQGLSRKHIVEGAHASLRRIHPDYVDIIFCHRPEPYTPIEETVRAINYYKIFPRDKGEFEYVDLYKKFKLGLTTFSPLAYGTLTGKYSSGKPDGSRFTKPAFAKRAMIPTYDERVEIADQLVSIAEELGCSLPQLATAWRVSNEHMSTVLVGANRPEQLEENLKAIEFVVKITPEVKAKIDAIYSVVPTGSEMNPLVY